MLRVLPYAYTLALIALSFVSVESNTMGLLWAAGLAAALGMVLRMLIGAQCFATASLVTLFGLAYFVGAQEPLGIGFFDPLAVISADAVRQGLSMVVAFLAAVSLGAVLLSKLAATKQAALGLGRFMDFGGQKALLWTLSIAGLVVTGAAFSANAWTFYGTGDGDIAAIEATDKVPLQYAYLPMLFSSLAASTWAVLRSVTEPSTLRQRLIPLGVAAMLVFQAFLLQSRRLQVGALVCGAWAIMPTLHEARYRGRALVLMVAGVAGGATLLGLLMWGSFLWRTTMVFDQDQSVGSRLSDVADAAVTEDQSGSAAVESGLDRFTYLWMESLIQEYAVDAQSPFSLGDLVLSNVVRVIPAIIYPEKRGFERVTCESTVRIVNHQDLPCTATAEAQSVGGLGALLVVALSWSMVFALADRLILLGTLSGVLLSCMLCHNFMFLETGVVPWVSSLRMVLLLLMIGGVAGLPRLLGLTRRTDAPSEHRNQVLG